MTEDFTHTMDAVGKWNRPHARVTRKTVPAIDSIQFPQWTVIELPDPYDGFFGYLPVGRVSSHHKVQWT